MADRGYSLVAFGAAAGLPAESAKLLPWLVGVPVLAVAPVVARREDGDRRAFSVAIIAALLLTPIVWLHYFALLVVPLALARPRLAWAWGLLWLLWLTPGHVAAFRSLADRARVYGHRRSARRAAFGDPPVTDHNTRAAV